VRLAAIMRVNACVAGVALLALLGCARRPMAPDSGDNDAGPPDAMAQDARGTERDAESIPDCSIDAVERSTAYIACGEEACVPPDQVCCIRADVLPGCRVHIARRPQARGMLAGN